MSTDIPEKPGGEENPLKAQYRVEGRHIGKRGPQNAAIGIKARRGWKRE